MAILCPTLGAQYKPSKMLTRFTNIPFPNLIEISLRVIEQVSVNVHRGTNGGVFYPVRNVLAAGSYLDQP
jgi:hypothetical protein